MVLQLVMERLEWMKVEFPGFSHVPEDVKFLQSVWKGPIVLKGIQSVADALMCVELGSSSIVPLAACPAS